MLSQNGDEGAFLTASRSAPRVGERLELSDADPASLFADGRLVGTFPDPWITVPRAHLLMLLHDFIAGLFSYLNINIR